MHGIVNVETLRIDEYIAQEIAREILNPLLLRIFEVILKMIRGHVKNSEIAIKYQGILYQHYMSNEQYLLMSQTNPYFKSSTCPKPEYTLLIT